jgi:hypothetical protein
VLLLQLASMTRLPIRPQRVDRPRVVTRGSDRFGRANEMRLNTTAVGTLTGGAGLGTAWLAHLMEAVPSWQTLLVAAVAVAFAACLAPRLWRFMNAR